MIKRWFVTGTDTEVGKTVASSALLQAANRAGYRSAGYKPVASGSEMTAEDCATATRWRCRPTAAWRSATMK